MDEHDDRRPAKPHERKKPRKLSERYLENSALHYLKRYSATVDGVRRVMMRRVNRSLKEHGGDKAEAVAWLEALLQKLVRNGLVNDTAYAETRAHALRASGRSARVISQKLRLKGVAPELAAQKLAQASEEVSEDAAARIWARKKRLGPFRRDLSTRKDKRMKDLAALARAGFSFATAKRVIDGSADEGPAE